MEAEDGLEMEDVIKEAVDAYHECLPCHWSSCNLHSEPEREGRGRGGREGGEGQVGKAASSKCLSDFQQWCSIIKT